VISLQRQMPRAFGTGAGTHADLDNDVIDLIERRKIPVFIIEEDLAARGIERGELVPGVPRPAFQRARARRSRTAELSATGRAIIAVTLHCSCRIGPVLCYDPAAQWDCPTLKRGKRLVDVALVPGEAIARPVAGSHQTGLAAPFPPWAVRLREPPIPPVVREPRRSHSRAPSPHCQRGRRVCVRATRVMVVE
jgi:hypothetical protein